jgi:hypothetical protein
MNKKKPIPIGVHFKLSPVGEDTNRGCPPWAVSSLPTSSPAMRKFEMKKPISD